MNTDGHGSPSLGTRPFPVAVIDAVLAAGVCEFVICAGARNSALVVVLAAIEKKVRLWQHFDERAAGFFAIGRIRAAGMPVAVVTTSGTAVAELLPAVIEAHYQGLPLVALTADRPKSYRGSGAPQAIEQNGILSCYPSLVVDTEDEPVNIDNWSKLGPLHLNVCLPEMDTDAWRSIRNSIDGIEFPAWSAPWFPDIFCIGNSPPHTGNEESRELTPSAGRLVLLGDVPARHRLQAAALASIREALICADASSGARDLPYLQDDLIRCGDATISHLPLRHVIRIGGVPSVRFWRDLEDRPDISVSWMRPSPYPGLARRTGIERLGDSRDKQIADVPVADYLARDAALYARLGEILTLYPASEPALFRRLSQIISNGTTVFTGNSLPVREWNLCAEYGRGHRVHVLRGANGIDGNLSAFLGIAADKAEAWCITGDLTAMYDLSAPWMLRQLPPGKRRFVVIQNGGGKIFSRLPALRELNERERALMENPHDISLRGWAEMWGMDHVSGGAELLNNSGALAALADHAVIELYPNAGATEAFWQAWAEAEQEVWA